MLTLAKLTVERRGVLVSGALTQTVGTLAAVASRLFAVNQAGVAVLTAQMVGVGLTTDKCPKAT